MVVPNEKFIVMTGVTYDGQHMWIQKKIIIKHTHKNNNNSPTYERIKANIQAIFYVLLKFSVKKYEMEMGRH